MDYTRDDKQVSLNDFTTISVIGQGSYAKVALVQQNDTKQKFAMKILKKEKIEQSKQEEHVMVERNVLVNMKHPFIVKMSYSFQNEQQLYFVLEYCPGGQLFNLLQKRQQFTEDQTRFYAAQIVLALEHIHSHNVIYRDLKPENVLIDHMGYIRITDFGLSKANIKGTKDAKSVCGTPEYLAPEVLFKMGHGKAVDWWTLGAIIYEMLTGFPPFYTNDRDELFERIQFGTLKFPPHITPVAKDLLERLFCKQPQKRLGAKGAQEIKEHPWFVNVNWEILLRKEYKPPFIPIIQGDLDVSNFDREFTELDIDSFTEQSMAIQHKVYMNFTYDEQKQQNLTMETEEKK